MNNKILNGLREELNYGKTENGALKLNSTLSDVYDLFALGGAYRTRSDSDCIVLFRKALEENETLALKCLFYLRDIRGGAGERRFFRVIIHWLGDNYPELILRNFENISEMGRWDDYYALVDTKVEKDMFKFLREQLTKDIYSCLNGDKNGVSLLAKWLKSENASSIETKRLAALTRRYFHMSPETYRLTLSMLRERINVLEMLMSTDRWDEIEFDKVPSKAGFIYRNAFARRDLIAKKYKDFITSDKTIVNSKDLFVHEIVAEATGKTCHGSKEISSVERAAINKYWEDLPNYFNGKEGNILCVCDTSSSMCHYGAKYSPINVSIGLSMYCAERLKGPFHNHFITFSCKPSLVEISGKDFVDKATRIMKSTINDNTNLEGVFKLLLSTAIKNNLKQSDLPEKIIVISDMEIDAATRLFSYNNNSVTWYKNTANSLMEKIAKEWAANGYIMPKLIYWNVDARQDTFLQRPKDNVTFISGFSQQLMKNVVSGRDGVDLMLEVLNNDRYSNIK